MGIIYSLVSTKKSQTYTTLALESFFKHTKLKNHDEVYLIDNDNCWIKNDSFNYKIITNELPLSFSKNVNKIINLCLLKDKHLCFSNNDVIFTPNWYDSFFLHDNFVLIPNSNEFIQTLIDDWFMTFTMEYNDVKEKINYIKKFSSNLNNSLVEIFDSPYHISFYCFFVNNKVLKNVGFFDEKFINGGEDVDYKIRCHLADVKVFKLNKKFVFHFGGKSTYQCGNSFKEILKNEIEYEAYFREKWGDILSILFLKSKFNNLDSETLKLIGINNASKYSIKEIIQHSLNYERKLKNYVLY